MAVLDLGSVVGPQGPKGEPGETGPAGPQGPRGPQGSPGAAYEYAVDGGYSGTEEEFIQALGSLPVKRYVQLPGQTPAATGPAMPAYAADSFAHFAGGLSAGNQRLQAVATPEGYMDAANKSYVDQKVQTAVRNAALQCRRVEISGPVNPGAFHGAGFSNPCPADDAKMVLFLPDPRDAKLFDQYGVKLWMNSNSSYSCSVELAVPADVTLHAFLLWLI